MLGLARGAVVAVIAVAALVRIEEWPRTIVGIASAAVYSNPDATSAVTRHVPVGGVVRVCSNNGTWADVLMYSPSLGNGRGWMRSQDLVSSEGLRQYWREQFENAVALLTVETRSETKPIVAAWMRFHLGYAQWATGDLAAARATFEAIGSQRDNLYGPYAWLAAAKIALVRDDTTTAIAEYEGLVRDSRRSSCRGIASASTRPRCVGPTTRRSAAAFPRSRHASFGCRRTRRQRRASNVFWRTAGPRRLSAPTHD